jgi:DNA invertase Pin-like site-specific DNA recombinase
MTDPSALPLFDTLEYRRVSTEQQAGDDRTSLGEQHRANMELARKLGRVLDPRAVFEDPGVSGATAEGRPGFMAMVRYCEAHPRPRSAPGVILVLNDSRFGRFDDPEEATHWRFVLKRLGWHVRFAEGDDVEDGIARGVLRFIGSAQASEYRANLKRTARRASRATAEQGRWQNEAPIGYRRLATRTDGSQRVLVSGLGLGCVVRGLLAKPEVEHVDVVEISRSILSLVGREFDDNPRVSVHYGDAELIRWPRRTRWDCAWHDVWSEREGLAVVHARLMARYDGRVRVQGAWQFPREVKRLWPRSILGRSARTQRRARVAA